MQKKIAYTGYFIIITVVFLYYLFPGDAVTSYINYKINNMSPDVKISVSGLQPDFPPGMKFLSPDLRYRNLPVVGADWLRIKPAYLSLFSDNKTFFVNGDIYTGNLESVIRLADFSANPAFDAETTFANIQISQIPILEQFQSYQISGIAGGQVIFDNKEVKAGKGTAQIIVTDVSVEFTPALFGLEQLTFKSVNTEFEINGPRVEVKKFDVDSRDVSASASGSIILRTPVNKSTINIRGEFKPHPAFIKNLGNVFPVEMLSRRQTASGSLPFRITGSLEQPNFALR